MLFPFQIINDVLLSHIKHENLTCGNFGNLQNKGEYTLIIDTLIHYITTYNPNGFL